MKSSRHFSRGVLNHIYQRTREKIVIFYSISDYLVYFTIMCLAAERHHVRLLMVSLMPDHIHLSALADRLMNLSRFMQESSRKFSLRHNKVCHHDGSLFERPFGSAPKYGDKMVRSNIIYVGNNGPERRLARKAEEYRWNFLAYAKSNHPFSEKLVLRRASSSMRRACSEVKSARQRRESLTYMQLQRLFAKLSPKEKSQLADYIICQYNVIDYEAASRYFGSYDEMLNAMHYNTGSEYDINEVVIGKSDAHYAKMASFCMRELHLKDIHDMLSLDVDSKTELFVKLSGQTNATPEQIAAFLRLPLKKRVM